jgi:hypothetical protein
MHRGCLDFDDRLSFVDAQTQHVWFQERAIGRRAGWLGANNHLPAVTFVNSVAGSDRFDCRRHRCTQWINAANIKRRGDHHANQSSCLGS